MPLVYPVVGVIFFQFSKNPEPTCLSSDLSDSRGSSEFMSVPPTALTWESHSTTFCLKPLYPKRATPMDKPLAGLSAKFGTCLYRRRLVEYSEKVKIQSSSADHIAIPKYLQVWCHPHVVYVGQPP